MILGKVTMWEVRLGLEQLREWGGWRREEYIDKISGGIGIVLDWNCTTVLNIINLVQSRIRLLFFRSPSHSLRDERERETLIVRSRAGTN